MCEVVGWGGGDLLFTLHQERLLDGERRCLAEHLRKRVFACVCFKERFGR